MAVITPSVVVDEDKTLIVTWAGLALNDTGAAVKVARYTDKTVQATGTFGVGGNVKVQGSNLANPAGADWGDCNDPQGVVIGLGDVNPVVVSESPLMMRPNINAGDGSTLLTVTVIASVKGA